MATAGGGGRPTASPAHASGPGYKRDNGAHVQRDPRSPPRPPGRHGRGSRYRTASEHGLFLVARADDGAGALRP